MEASHEFDFEICTSRIRPIADDLIKKYEELRHLDVEKILFVVNHKSAGSKKSMTLARTARLPEKWRDILYQMGACSFTHIVEFYGKTTALLDENQMIALIYRELRRIGPEGKLVTPDVHDWWQVLMGLGRNWFYPGTICPNLLDQGVDWQVLMKGNYEPPKIPD